MYLNNSFKLIYYLGLDLAIGSKTADKQILVFLNFIASLDTLDTLRDAIIVEWKRF